MISFVETDLPLPQTTYILSLEIGGKDLSSWSGVKFGMSSLVFVRSFVRQGQCFLTL